MRSSSSDFEAIVASNSMNSVNPRGEKVLLVGILPTRALDIPAQKFDALQAAYKGELTIVRHRDRVVIEQTVLACSANGVRQAARRLADSFQQHLEVRTAVQ